MHWEKDKARAEVGLERLIKTIWLITPSVATPGYFSQARFLGPMIQMISESLPLATGYFD